jgi:uncharacterized protein YaaQ
MDDDGGVLCVIVVPEPDGTRLVEALQRMGAHATRLSSTGGFLRRGSSTVLSAVRRSQIDKVSSLLHAQFPSRVESLPAELFPWHDDAEVGGALIPVRASGAVMFVVPLDRFVRV